MQVKAAINLERMVQPLFLGWGARSQTVLTKIGINEVKQRDWLSRASNPIVLLHTRNAHDAT
ncbi:hypothetical protein GCM10007857_50000 [Bradyrhizobium iriomotense]|uniref:Uncharacterized protein n=1 Tax=Bradyrhizobium iriomotense TaxID=441950 RepID=A0ABQ6B2F8_9BRAD|nr:hypothetical protein GCM10007857_50000 [Bradyrhizobium iriomotense]